MILRSLAGSGKDRAFARREIIKAGGTPNTIIALARLIGTALALGFDIRRPGTRHISIDESDLLKRLAQQQRYRRRSVGNMDEDLLNSLIDAAVVFRGIGVNFPPSMLNATLLHGRKPL